MTTDADVLECRIPWLESSAGVATLTKSVVETWAVEQRGGHLFITITLARPRDMKAIRRTQLSAGDMAVSVHRVLTWEKPCVVVGATAVNIEKSMDAFDDAVALILSLRVFSLEDILRVRRCVTIASGLAFDTAMLRNNVLATAILDVSEVVLEMLEHDKPIPGEHSVEMQQVLASLYEEGLVEMKEGTWYATGKARAARVSRGSFARHWTERLERKQCRILWSGKPSPATRSKTSLCIS